MDLVRRLKGSVSLDGIQIIKIQGGSLDDSFLYAGYGELKNGKLIKFQD